ncbi:MAG: ACT domain-containing protein [Deltaproteobacteria bacterium]|nr:ACT domain-containing protein [Deltaproteobacteria bacterium]
MVRMEISLFLKNVPGELGKLGTLLGDKNINIDALTIQDASAYVMELFKARDSAEFALIRLLVDQTDNAIDLLTQNDYIFDILPVIAVHLENKPGKLAEIATKLGEEGININYIYGSVAGPDDKSFFVFSPEDIELAAKVYAQ